MADYTKVAEKTFTADLIQQGSWGATSLGTHRSTMTLYQCEPKRFFIEWVIPAIDDVENIGIWLEDHPDEPGKLQLSDYDGVHSLPKEAVLLLREHGIHVPKEFE